MSLAETVRRRRRRELERGFVPNASAFRAKVGGMRAAPSPFSNHLGRRVSLVIRRFGPSGAFLGFPGAGSSPDAPSLLLLGPEIPEGAREGDELSVFVYLDSQDRPLATTATPLLQLEEVGFLRVKDCNKFGAFFDWGLPKDLMVPFAEQVGEPRVGDRHAVGVYLDSSGRLTGTMKVNRLLGRAPNGVRPGQWVQGEAWRNDPEIGLFAILEKSWSALLPKYEPHTLARGEAARFRIANLLADGKVELSLRAVARDELGDDKARLLALLSKPDPPTLGDHSPPEQVRALCGMSKKAFKRAAGVLLKERTVTIDGKGCFVLAPRTKPR